MITLSTRSSVEMIFRAKEGEIAWIPGVGLDDLPQSLPTSIRIHAKRSLIGIEAQGVAGSIPLRGGNTLHISPKIGQVNFLRMLFKAEGLQTDLLREYDEFVEFYVDEEEALNSLVARQLLVSAAEIMGRSPMFGRVEKKKRGTFAIGRLDAAQTAFNLASRMQDPVAYSIKERTFSIPENRIITEAILRAFQMLSQKDSTEFEPIYFRWLERFSRSKDIWADLACIEVGFSEGQYGGPRDYYRKALMLSQIILGSGGLGLGEAAVVHGDAILLNTADVFERYLRNIVANCYSTDGYIVTKGGVETQSLYTDGSYEIEPDIVISRDGKCVLIADAKYKRPSSSDHYQMNSYLTVTEATSGILLAPLYSGSEVILSEYATRHGAVIREAYLPMDNLIATEAFLNSLVERFGQ